MMPGQSEGSTDALEHALDLLEEVFGCDKGMREDEWIEFCNEHLPFMHAHGRIKSVVGYS